MFLIVSNYIIGLIGGFILEFSYRSIEQNKLRMPLFADCQIYGLATVLIYLVYLLSAPVWFVSISLLVITTGLELAFGLYYLKYKNIRLWDYSAYAFNYKGLICLRFSFYWLVISIVYCYWIIPLLVHLA